MKVKQLLKSDNRIVIKRKVVKLTPADSSKFSKYFLEIQNQFTKNNFFAGKPRALKLFIQAQQYFKRFQKSLDKDTKLSFINRSASTITSILESKKNKLALSAVKKIKTLVRSIRSKQQHLAKKKSSKKVKLKRIVKI
jgi:hypothetical protein